MRVARRFALSAIVFFCFAPMLPNARTAQSDEVLPGSVSRSIFSPYYTVEPGWLTVLGLNNSTRVPITVSPTIYSLDGVGVPMSPVRLEPHEMKEIHLADWVAPLGDNYLKGSVRLEYVGVPFGLRSVITATDEQNSLALNIPLRARGEFKSSQLEAVWWVPNDDARLAVAVVNTTDHAVNASVIISRPEGHELKRHPLPLAAHQTRFVNLRQLVAREDALSGGISIQHDGLPGAILAEGFVLDRDAGFSLNLPFQDPATFGDSKLEGAGVMIGLSNDSGQPAVQFSGRLLLRNVSSAPITASPVLQRGTEQTALGSVNLAPGEARVIHISPSQAPSGEGAVGIQIPHTGTPGSLIGHWFSVDASHSLVVETPLKSPSHHEHTGGSNPWSLAGDTTAVTYVKNAGAETAEFAAYISYPGGLYVLGFLQVGPGETYAIDIRKLRDAQTPDIHGNVLPADLAGGQTNWRWREGAPLIGRTNVMSRAAGIAQNMSCEICACSQLSPQMELRPLHAVTLNVGETYQSTEIRQWDGGCDTPSPYIFFLEPSALTWETDPPNSPVASVNSVGLILANSPGTVTVTARRNFSQFYFNLTSYTADGEPVGECAALPDADVVDSIAVTVNPLVTTDDVIVIAWVDPLVIALPSGANQQLVDKLNFPGSCVQELTIWAAGSPLDLTSDADRAYANAYLVKNSGNAAPLLGIDPNTVLAAGDFRLFNRFKVKFSSSGGGISNLTILQSQSEVGNTPDPCYVFPSVSGQAHFSNGARGVTASGANAFQLTEGRIGSAGQLVFLTINVHFTPWIWSVIKFDASGNLNTSDHAIFPTYYVYRNGVRIAVYPQSAISSFVIKDSSYERLPSQIQ